MSPIRRLRLLPLAVATAACLTACGGGSGANQTSGSPAPAGTTATSAAGNGIADLSADQILTRAEDALADAGTVHVKGAGASGGSQFALDMRYGATGAVGSLSTNGQTVELVRVGPTVYFKGSDAFWRSIGGGSAAEILKGKYLKVPATTPSFAQIAAFTDLKKNVHQLLSPGGKLRKGERKAIRGTEAIGLVDSADGATLYVALQGKPYPLRTVPSPDAKEDSGSLDFLDYEVPVAVTAPPADHVVDISKLGGR